MHRGQLAARMSAARSGLLKAAEAAAKAKLIPVKLADTLSGARHKDKDINALFQLEALVPVFKELVNSGPKAQTAALKKDLAAGKRELKKSGKALAAAEEQIEELGIELGAHEEVRALAAAAQERIAELEAAQAAGQETAKDAAEPANDAPAEDAPADAEAPAEG